MDKTIESKFFEAFKWGGVVNNCIDWMMYTYHLQPMKPQDGRAKAAKKEWEQFFTETLPKEILAATEAFDDSVIKYMDSPLMDEIEANLNECKTDAQRERYLFSLLKPFGESPSGCGIARIFNPTAQINRLYKNISDCENDKAVWQAVPETDTLKKESGKQIEACNSEIVRYREQIDWIKDVNHQFCVLTGKVEDGAKWRQKGTVEWCLSCFVDVMIRFADRLDALLLTYGIDLMRLQNESGIYLKRHRLITDIESYVGSRELAQKYIDALPKEPQPEQAVTASQQERQKPTRKKGRPEKPFKDQMIDDVNGEKLKKMHTIIDGKKGKDVALIVLACIKKGWLTKPTYTQVKNEFEEIGSKTGYNRYLNEHKFTKEEIEGAINSLD